MNDGMWTWTCDVCGEPFARVRTREEAYAAFATHATQNHNAKVVYSAATGHGWRT